METPNLQPRSTLGRPRRKPWVPLAVAAAVAAAAVAFFLLRGEAPVEEAPAPAPAASPTPAPAPPEIIVAPERVRPAVESMSSDPLFRRGAAEPDLLRRAAVAIDNLAEGEVPVEPLRFAAPGRRMTVVERRGRLYIDPASYRRYDALANAVASVDAKVAAAVYRELHGALQRAYRALGYPDASLDAVTARALRRIEAAPLREGDLPVRERGALYAYSDPALEELAPLEKNLLRMGPRNERILQEKARELLAALGLPSLADPGAPPPPSDAPLPPPQGAAPAPKEGSAGAGQPPASGAGAAGPGGGAGAEPGREPAGAGR